MQTVSLDVQSLRAVQAWPFTAPADFRQEIALARRLALLMDSQFQIGPVRFGLDSIVGLVPVVGDVVTMLVGVYPIYLARKHGLGRAVIARMWANLAIDFAGGLVPVVGDICDVLLKANLKNLKLLESAARRRRLL